MNPGLSKNERLAIGVFGGVLIGYALGGPVGMILGACLGAALTTEAEDS